MSKNITHKIRKLGSAMILTCVSFIVISGCGEKSDGRPSPKLSDTLSSITSVINIEYSSPGVKKRKVWGELVPYSTIWRTGANKATYLKTTSDLYIDGELLEKGTYSIFTIPREKEPWTIIFNYDWDQWGSYNYDESKDALRTEITPQKAEFQEKMTFKLDTGKLAFHWENLTYTLEFQLFE